ncbi:hypothetical protein ACFC5Z_41970, partial [Streptomyces sp. NPDC056004]|uniref:hypothetical protein n=1 Tax=Streptomyces sp. NPDC056004 TaxID=3345677 RepID=UPI0035E1E71A
HHGPVTTDLTVRYTDGTTAELPVTVGDWAGSGPLSGARPALCGQTPGGTREGRPLPRVRR